jgi:hypothetical protein
LFLLELSVRLYTVVYILDLYIECLPRKIKSSTSTGFATVFKVEIKQENLSAPCFVCGIVNTTKIIEVRYPGQSVGSRFT